MREKEGDGGGNEREGFFLKKIWLWRGLFDIVSWAKLTSTTEKTVFVCVCVLCVVVVVGRGGGGVRNVEWL